MGCKFRRRSQKVAASIRTPDARNLIYTTKMPGHTYKFALNPDISR